MDLRGDDAQIGPWKSQRRHRSSPVSASSTTGPRFVSTTTGVDDMTKDIAALRPILVGGVLIAVGMLAACSSTPEIVEEDEAPGTEVQEETTEDALVEMTAVLDGYEGDQRVQMLHELAELHRMRSLELVDESLHARDRCFSAEPEESPACLEEVDRLKEESIHHHEEADRLLGEILTGYPNYEHIDRVLLDRGDLLRAVGRSDAAMELYERLIEEHPRSESAPWAHLAMGDHHFYTEELAQALTHYDAAAESSDPSVAHYGLYKAAWTHFNTEEFHSAVESMERVIKHTRRENDDEAGLVYEQALGDYARFLTRSDLSVEGVKKRLDELTKEEARRVRERMALLCEEHHSDEACEMSQAIE